jgi:hypothetical protein
MHNAVKEGKGVGSRPRPVYPGECGGWAVRPLFLTSTAVRRPTYTCFHGNPPPKPYPMSPHGRCIRIKWNSAPFQPHLNSIYTIFGSPTCPLPCPVRPCFSRHFLPAYSITHMYMYIYTNTYRNPSHKAIDGNITQDRTIASIDFVMLPKKGKNVS